MIEALALVDAPFECVILGDGGHRAHCEALSKRLGLGGRVQFKGFVPHDEIKGYYRECSVVAVSSLWPEPFGMVGIEAMRYALPVVAFDAGGIREWLEDGETGHLVPWGDRAAYAQRVRQLLRDKEQARRMGEAGLRRVTERFSFEGYVRGLESSLQRLANGG